MIGASKILTVSYGTFSCTLEGFDDPFNTMKAIAEYFRDLAAEDRYFGAEPPTPDAAMLHRIAEREVHRRVEARVQDNGVILRAAEIVPSVGEPAIPAPAAVVPEETAAPFVTPVVVDLDTVMGGNSPISILPALNPMPEGVAARLAKIRAAVALAEPDVASPAAVILSDFAEDQHADEAFAPFADDSVATPIDLEELEELEEHFEVDVDAYEEAEAALRAALSVDDDPIVADRIEEPSVADAIDEALFADTPDDDASSLIADLTALDAADPTAAVAAVDTDDAMLADLDVPIDAAPDVSGDADVMDDFTADDVEDTDDDDGTLLSNIMADPTADGIAAVADEDQTDIVIVEDALIDPDADDAAGPWSNAAETPAELLLPDDPDDAAIENLAMEDAQVAPADMAEPAMANLDTLDMDVEPTPETDTQETAPTDPEGPALVEQVQLVRARVIRVRRSAEIAIDRAAHEAPAAAPVAMPADAAASSLPDDAEAELQRELAALEADSATRLADAPDTDADLQRQLADVFNDTQDTAIATDADADLRSQLAGLAADGTPATDAAREPGVEEDAVRRLMDQTQSEMAVPENRRRLSSIAHLKAAVAATIAERFGSKVKPVEEVEATRTEPYRNDLARAVRPIRQTGADGQSERPAPLVLVSEQRIDRPAAVAPAATITPVRPRRVTAQATAALQPAFDDDLEDETDLGTGTDNIFGDAKGFAEFADRVGAHRLTDLLEAAAAYAAAVEGYDSFTRPQLLRQIATVSGSDVTREDELRSFGALLRDGRIVKVRRGQFALADASPLLIEARKIAG